jgi:mono/diheme cytochrome c family protein
VVEVITWGKAKMPSFRGALTEQQLQELLAYLHTL